MEVFGGRAGYNYVSFTGEKYQSLSRFKDGKITTEMRPIKEDAKITIILSKIPFIRSYNVLFETIIENLKSYLLLVISVILLEFLLTGKSNTHFFNTISLNSLEILLCCLIISGIIIKITSIGRYHAAEHMVANAYLKNSSLTLDMVKQQPRTHKDCGTNLVMSIVICYAVLFMIFGDTFWVILVSWSIGYELWRNEPLIIWSTVLIIGKVAQYLLLTTKPKEKHLIVAMEAMRKLEQKELANKD